MIVDVNQVKAHTFIKVKRNNFDVLFFRALSGFHFVLSQNAQMWCQEYCLSVKKYISRHHCPQLYIAVYTFERKLLYLHLCWGEGSSSIQM